MRLSSVGNHFLWLNTSGSQKIDARTCGVNTVFLSRTASDGARYCRWQSGYLFIVALLLGENLILYLDFAKNGIEIVILVQCSTWALGVGSSVRDSRMSLCPVCLEPGKVIQTLLVIQY